MSFPSIQSAPLQWEGLPCQPALTRRTDRGDRYDWDEEDYEMYLNGGTVPGRVQRVVPVLDSWARKNRKLS